MAVNVIAQGITPSAKLSAVYSAAELSQMSAEKKDQLGYFATKCYSIHEKAKAEGYPLLSSAIDAKFSKQVSYKSLTLDNFNPLMLRADLDRTDHLFFVIDGTDKVVQIYSEDYADMRYRDYSTTQRNIKKNKK